MSERTNDESHKTNKAEHERVLSRLADALERFAVLAEGLIEERMTNNFSVNVHVCRRRHAEGDACEEVSGNPKDEEDKIKATDNARPLQAKDCNVSQR